VVRLASREALSRGDNKPVSGQIVAWSLEGSKPAAADVTAINGALMRIKERITAPPPPIGRRPRARDELTPMENEALVALWQAGEAVSGDRLADISGLSAKYIYTTMPKLIRMNLAEKVHAGYKYKPPEK
jgi:hypothetical protein